jgi:nucleoside-diphosphate-sugar epimerase
MRVLYTGADGYIGTILGSKLLERGHRALGVDTGLYRRGWLFEDGRTRPSVVTRDVRQLTQLDLEGFDAVVHLAELSNDPLGNNDPAITHEINHLGSVGFAKKCRAAGIERFIYASSCSIYGASGTEMKSETSSFEPQTAYARCKTLVERDVSHLVSSHFAPVFLRNATAFGASPRQRFDLVLNDLAGSAFTSNTIEVKSDGSPCRPLVHVEDICEAIVCALEAPREAVCGEAFNVGSDDQNYTVREIAEIVHSVFPEADMTFGPKGPDNRSYRVSFRKIREHMPEFKCRWDAHRGSVQLRCIFERIQLDASTYKALPFTRLSELNHLQTTRQVDSRLFWTPLENFAGAGASTTEDDDTACVVLVGAAGAKSRARRESMLGPRRSSR